MPDDELMSFRAHAAHARALVGTPTVRELSRQRRPGLIVTLTALLWAQLDLALALAAFGPPLAVIIAFPVIVILKHAMVLWVHEASHGLRVVWRKYGRSLVASVD